MTEIAVKFIELRKRRLEEKVKLNINFNEIRFQVCMNIQPIRIKKCKDNVKKELKESIRIMHGVRRNQMVKKTLRIARNQKFKKKVLLQMKIINNRIMIKINNKKKNYLIQ